MTVSTIKPSRPKYLWFVAGVTVAHVVTYLLAGMITYEFVYKSTIEAGGFDPTLRSPRNAAEWQHVTQWLFPAQILRGALFGVALCPFFAILSTWRILRRFATLLLLLLVFSVWSVTMPGSGSIEGWLYLRPDIGLKLENPWLGLIEVPSQLAAFSLMISWWIGRLTQEPSQRPSSSPDDAGESEVTTA